MKQFFYLDSSNAQRGPIPGEDLMKYGVTSETLVWTEGMPDWRPASLVDDLKPIFAPQPPAPEVTRLAQPVTPQPQAAPRPQMASSPQAQPAYRPAAQQAYTPNNNGGMPPKPATNLVWAILCTLFCCQIFGIMAIVSAIQVESKYNNGDYAGAKKASDDAKKWSLWGAIGGGIIIVVYTIIMIVSAAAGSASSSYYY